MAKHTQTIRRLLPTNCLSVFDHFEGLALKRVKKRFPKLDYKSSVSEGMEVSKSFKRK